MMDDHRQIARLVHEYAHRFDAAQFDEFAALFANGTLTLTGLAPPATGVTAVHETIARLVILYDGSPRTNHIMSNVTIDVSPDGHSASGRAYVEILQAVSGFPLQIIATGIYSDRFTRRDGVWQFTERTSAGSLIGDVSRHLRLPERNT
jgi:hypothetical protein